MVATLIIFKEIYHNLSGVGQDSDTMKRIQLVVITEKLSITLIIHHQPNSSKNDYFCETVQSNVNDILDTKNSKLTENVNAKRESIQNCYGQMSGNIVWG